MLINKIKNTKQIIHLISKITYNTSVNYNPNKDYYKILGISNTAS